MPSDTEPTTVSKRLPWAGAIVTALVVTFLAFDGVTKILQVAPVVEASEKLGIPPRTAGGIGIVLVTCTAIYAVPRTAILGAILLTGYLGGAAAIHVRAESGPFAIAFSIAIAVLVWVGLSLREPRLLWKILIRA